MINYIFDTLIWLYLFCISNVCIHIFPEVIRVFRPLLQTEDASYFINRACAVSPSPLLPLLWLTASDLGFCSSTQLETAHTHCKHQKQYYTRGGDGWYFREDLRGHLRGDKTERRYVACTQTPLSIRRRGANVNEHRSGVFSAKLVSCYIFS